MEAKERELLLGTINNIFIPKIEGNKGSFYTNSDDTYIQNIMEYDYDSPDSFLQLLNLLWHDDIYQDLKTIITVAVFKEHDNNIINDGKISEYIYEF